MCGQKPHRKLIISDYSTMRIRLNRKKYQDVVLSLLNEGYAINKRRALCVYCGFVGEHGDNIKNHMLKCPKHPMRELERRINELESELAAWQSANHYTV